MPETLNVAPDLNNDFGRALAMGKLVGTVQGSSGHITVRAVPKAKVGGKWKQARFEDATHVFLDVPSAGGEWADKIGTYYPPTAPKYAGQFYADRQQTDERRVKAALYLLKTAAGVLDGRHVEQGKSCLRCGRDITHPDSLRLNFGPECAEVVGLTGNRSGTPEGAHEKKAPTGGEWAAAQEALDVASGLPPVEQLQAPAREFVPPTPDFSKAPSAPEQKPVAQVREEDAKIVVTLRAGDDPIAVLARIDA